tara:strand:+ start:6061 stop:7011 length:951 start_codon:yes stop_codon:yes gene_type:complete
VSLVSIIIPTYNRAHLIEETLNSILEQTYTNWEALIIDDRSTDSTEALLERYTQKDNRFQYYIRPRTTLKGGNVCRNIGLEKAKGAYVVFFDSDDLMTPDHLEVKVSTMLENNCDYCITKTKNLTGSEPLPKHYYAFNQFELTVHNYMLQHLNWLTLDICIKSDLARSIRFNEQLKSGQEYNYYSKLVLQSTNAVFVPKEVSLRRIHQGSIRSSLEKKRHQLEGSFYSYWETYKELHKQLSLSTRRQLLYTCIRICYKHGSLLASDKKMFLNTLQEHFTRARFNFLMLLFFKRTFNRGYYFRNKFKQQAFNLSNNS